MAQLEPRDYNGASKPTIKAPVDEGVVHHDLHYLVTHGGACCVQLPELAQGGASLSRSNSPAILGLETFHASGAIHRSNGQLLL
ncbi:MAG: hypothetical protein HOI95_00170 [Chromatiales bacterium]|jgi:hypothetical protein|nr:hypothetical protein [Chromatiales bacterium]